MKVITNFLERKEQKRFRLERSVLVELSLSEIIKDVRKRFLAYNDRSLFIQRELEETCVDMAIDAYLAGVSYSKFIESGETVEKVRARADQDLKQSADALFDYWLFWGEYDAVFEELYHACASFIGRWWQLGLEKGVKRRRLRLY